jgi:hypothetical protein
MFLRLPPGFPQGGLYAPHNGPTLRSRGVVVTRGEGLTLWLLAVGDHYLLWAD